MDTKEIVSAISNLESSNSLKLSGVEDKLNDVVTVLKRIERVLEEIKNNQ